MCFLFPPDWPLFREKHSLTILQHVHTWLISLIRYLHTNTPRREHDMETKSRGGLLQRIFLFIEESLQVVGPFHFELQLFQGWKSWNHHLKLAMYFSISTLVACLNLFGTCHVRIWEWQFSWVCLKLITTLSKKSPKYQKSFDFRKKSMDGQVRLGAPCLKTLPHIATNHNCHDHRPHHYPSQHKIWCQAWSFITQQQQRGGLFRCCCFSCGSV